MTPLPSSQPSGRPPPRVIAVVGATTFFGEHLLGVLEEDPRVDRIVAVGEKTSPGAGAKTRSYELDVTQPGSEARLAEIFATEAIEAVVHVGFLQVPATAAAWAHEYESVGTMRVVVAARKASVGKFVGVSNTWLYGALPSNPNFLDEKRDLRASRSEPFFADKIEAEAKMRELAEKSPETSVTILRFSPIVGSTIDNLHTRWLSRSLVPTLLGHDPLFQFLHEIDAIAALKHALFRDVPGVYNIVGEGVVPLSLAIRLAGRTAIPLPRTLLRPLVSALWLAELAEGSEAFLPYLRYLCVADGSKAALAGFKRAYTSREALLDFGSTQRLRDARQLQEPRR